MSLLDPGKAAMRAALARLGYRIQRIAPEERLFELGYDPNTSLPHDAEAELRPDHPRLLELKARYRTYDSPVCRHTQWRSELSSTTADLRFFRGENAYVWQYLKRRDRLYYHEQARLKYYLYARYLRDQDRRDLLGRVLAEDGQFGCFTFHFEQMPVVSRDLLDSVNELYFLDRHWNLFDRNGTQVLDIGAGYGRMAHRMLAAAEGVERYWCIDAIPRSSFICEYYLRHRGLLGGRAPRAAVVPVDEMESAIPADGIDLAINIHSFSEMCHAAIAAWLQWLQRLNVPWLLIVPNEPEMLSIEADNTRRGYRALIEQAGYRLVVDEPTLCDPDVRELFGVYDHFLLFHRG